MAGPAFFTSRRCVLSVLGYYGVVTTLTRGFSSALPRERYGHPPELPPFSGATLRAVRIVPQNRVKPIWPTICCTALPSTPSGTRSSTSKAWTRET